MKLKWQSESAEKNEIIQIFFVRTVIKSIFYSDASLCTDFSA